MISGREFKELRKNKGLTLKEVAKVLNTSEQAVNKYELEIVRNIPLDRIEAMAKLYGVSPAYIMEWDQASLSSSDQADILFIEKYGQPVYDAAMKYSALDREDQSRIDERMDTMLEADKYKRASESGEKVI